MAEIRAEELQTVTGSHIVIVSFTLPYVEWRKLSEKKCWKKVQKFISGVDYTQRKR